MKSDVDVTFGFSLWILATGTPVFAEMTPKVSPALTLQYPSCSRSSRPVVTAGCSSSSSWCSASSEPCSSPDRTRATATVTASRNAAGRDVPPPVLAAGALPAGRGPDLLLQPRRLRTGCLAVVAAGFTEGVVDRARRGDERAGRAALERTLEVGDGAALRADARQKQDACGIKRRASATARGWVAPTTAPTEERPTSPTMSSPHSATSAATWCHSGRPSRERRSCTSPPAFDVLTRTKIPCRCAARPRGTARPTRGRGTR